MKKIILTITSLMIVVSAAYSADNSGAFLEKGFSASTEAMGGAGVALKGSGDAVVLNPAGLGYSQDYRFNTMFANMYGEVQRRYISGVVPISPKGALGITVISAGLEGILETTWDSMIVGGMEVNRANVTGKTFGYGATALMVGYGYVVRPDLSIGFTVKYVNEELYGYRSDGFGADIGVLYSPLENVTLGLNVKNIIKPDLHWNTPTQSVESVPVKASFGASGKYEDFNVAGEIEFQNNRELKLNLGVEYVYEDMIFLRAGLQNGAYTLGAGVEYYGVNVDYAYVNSPDGYLENNSFLSVGFTFEENAETQVAAKPVIPAILLDIDVLSAVVVKPVNRSVTFPDVTGHWARTAVENISSLGIVSGRPDGKFDPTGRIKKVEAAKMALLAYELKNNAAVALVDVNVDQSIVDMKNTISVSVKNEYGVLVKNIYKGIPETTLHIVWDGTDSHDRVVDDGTYILSAAIQNGDSILEKKADVFVRAENINLSMPQRTRTKYVDIKPTHWATGIIQRADDLNIISGETDLIYRPEKQVTKLDLILSLAGALKREGFVAAPGTKLTYSDVSSVAPENIDLLKIYVSVLGAGGDNKGRLNPDKVLTRAEAAVMLERYLTTNKVIAYRTDLLKTGEIENIKVKQTDELKKTTIQEEKTFVTFQIERTNTGKLIIKGEGLNTAGLTVNKQTVPVRPRDNKFYVKLNYREDKVIPIEVRSTDGSLVKLTAHMMSNKVIFRGTVQDLTGVTINSDKVYIKQGGLFYKKVFVDETTPVKCSFVSK